MNINSRSFAKLRKIYHRLTSLILYVWDKKITRSSDRLKS